MSFLIHVLAQALLVPAAAVAQPQDLSDVEIKAEKAADGLYMLPAAAATSASRSGRAAAS
jgi:hypothetical protein